ncbi:hypothetical protein F5Y17DRAFT_303996 [Xylariaceae sp. FL0594]|nr:hypothetical protein F5Y17DRAFT_303996 [Xylariaceae sp. FL0594]
MRDVEFGVATVTLLSLDPGFGLGERAGSKTIAIISRPNSHTYGTRLFSELDNQLLDLESRDKGKATDREGERQVSIRRQFLVQLVLLDIPIVWPSGLESTTVPPTVGWRGSLSRSTNEDLHHALFAAQPSARPWLDSQSVTETGDHPVYAVQ